MLRSGIIEESTSPWMSPAVLSGKSLDYRELNKKTQKDVYPLPLPDEVQDKLVLCCKYSLGPSRDFITVLVVPDSMQQEFLHQCHDDPAAGHQGVKKTLERLQGKGYWVNMNQHVESHCCECTKCQKFKLPQPTWAPLTSMPIGKPWQMVAVDILTVPIPTNGNKYLLVIQNYFTNGLLPFLYLINQQQQLLPH